jgi:catechol 2,3-dioxygenase-like lactoylglutathione lyase family enzyme
MRFEGICLVTHDVRALSRFCAEVLGVEAVSDDVHAELSPERAGIATYLVDEMERMAPQSMRGAGCESTIVMFQVDDVDAEYERLALGVEFVVPSTTHPWGARSTWFRDPDGNIVDFYANLGG